MLTTRNEDIVGFMPEILAEFWVKTTTKLYKAYTPCSIKITNEDSPKLNNFLNFFFLTIQAIFEQITPKSKAAMPPKATPPGSAVSITVPSYPPNQT